MPLSLFDALPAFEGYLLHEEALSPATVRQYRADTEKLANWLLTEYEHLTGWEQIGARELRVYMQQGRPAPARARRLVSSWKKLWRYLEDVEKLAMQRGPAELKSPKLPSKLPQPLSQEELSRLLNAARENANDDKGLRDWAILAFLYGTGLRISEALNLKLSDVEHQGGDPLPTAVRVVAKGNEERLIPLSATAQRALYQWLRVRKIQARGHSPLVFVHLSNGKAIPVRTVQAMMHRVAVRANVPAARATPHKLRHTFATNLVNVGRSLEEVQEALGHKNSNVTRRYAKLNRSRLKAAADALPDVD
ncbi:tyrosine-type recombinase/integrase [Deinococcus sp. HMF7620]|uniref:Tyrosine-type recombinase/integrase n=1 Tax=Deinococcus arboris TaxID=2682977 RepID=A0A7C9HSE3_9DEIO|nr:MULTISPECIES: tyrosine-type recombinase/integrase [Deinococcus]MBZ9752161.1 tyrosine-type recombinase/integrase [Deinococcus betulae]MVN87487.1 tyrosine-type recombinase/integrase [Deinococcus arboris]